MSDVLKIEEAFKRAEKVLQLAKDMNKAFSPEYNEEYLKMEIVAGIADAYHNGCDKGYKAGRISARIG